MARCFDFDTDPAKVACMEKVDGFSIGNQERTLHVNKTSLIRPQGIITPVYPPCFHLISIHLVTDPKLSTGLRDVV